MREEPEYSYGPTRPQAPSTGATLAGDGPPAYPTAGYVKPAEVERGCVGRTLGLTRKLAERHPGTVVVKFAVDRSGRPGPLDVLSDAVDGDSARALAVAVQSCRWTPGRDPQGRAANVWVILPIRLQLH